jgi:hypothetical protein
MNSKKNTDNKTTLSIGSESQYSATSPEFQTGGHLMSWLFGSGSGEYATELASDAFNNQYPQVGYFVIRHALDKSVSIDFSKVDSRKCNLLHHLTQYATVPLIRDLISVVLRDTNAKKYINEQDEHGNTPAHYAVKNELDDLVNELVASGSNLSIVNANGVSIGTNNSNTKSSQNADDIFVKFSSQRCNSSNDDDIEKRLDKLVRSFVSRTDSDTINFTGSDTKRESPRQRQSPRQQYLPRRNNIFSDQSMSMASDDILNMILNENNQQQRQQGGSKNSLSGRRTVVTYSELSGGVSDKFNSDDEDALDDEDFSELSSIARTVENQSNEAHKRAVERIKEILKVDETEARAYKAILYDAIKKEGEMSNYDRAMELEKRASNKDILEHISKKDIKNMIQLIDEKHKLRDSSSQKSSSHSEKSSEPEKPKRAKKMKEMVLSSESGLDTISSIDID